MQVNSKLFKSSLLIVLLCSTVVILKSFCFQWVLVDNNRAEVTINFLFPMDQEAFPNHVEIKGTLPTETTVDWQVEWISPTTAKFLLTEQSLIKGQEVTLGIQNAPTKYKGLYKKANIKVQFHEKVEMLSPTNELLIATDTSFLVTFNTPMNIRKMQHFISSDAAFTIEPVRVEEGGKVLVDTTQFYFTPKKVLENNTTYLIILQKGMAAQSGEMLSTDITLTVTTDSKPEIEAIYPKEKSKWVGLYPRIIIESTKPMKSASLTLDGSTIVGKLSNDYTAEFLLHTMLKPETVYEASFQAEAPSGEKSNPLTITFTTVALPTDRIWVEATLGDTNQTLRVYKGNQLLKEIVCSGGKKDTPTPLGTYYVLYKQENMVVDNSTLGANYLLQLTENVAIHGMLRDEYWNMLYKVQQNLGIAQTRGSIVVGEEDALWLYKTLPLDTMVVVHGDK